MKIFINDHIHEAGFEKMKKMGVEVISDFNRVDECDGMIVRGVVASRELLTKAKNLKVVGKHGAGYNTIDTAACKELGIRVVYTPGMNAQGVAELIVTLMLDVSRKVSYIDRCIVDGTYDDTRKSELTGWEIGGKTVAFVGFGNVSRKAAKILRCGFDMKVLAYDEYLPDEVFAENGAVKYASLEEMLPQADYVSICVPLTEETRNMFNAEMLSKMKPTAILINTARGGIVDEEALYNALTSGTIAGAGLDVFEEEPVSNKNRLVSLPNFVATPHIGGSTEESIFRVTDTVIDEVVAVLEGREPRFEVKL